MYGMDWDDPMRIRSWQDLIAWINDLWGYDRVTASYGEKPKISRDKIFAHLSHGYPYASEKQLEKIFK